MALVCSLPRTVQVVLRVVRYAAVFPTALRIQLVLVFAHGPSAEWLLEAVFCSVTFALLASSTRPSVAHSPGSRSTNPEFWSLTCYINSLLILQSMFWLPQF